MQLMTEFTITNLITCWKRNPAKQARINRADMDASWPEQSTATQLSFFNDNRKRNSFNILFSQSWII